MSIGEYFKHYISLPEVLIFFGLALLLVILVNVVLYLCSHIGAANRADKKQAVYERYLSLSQRFYELIFSGSSILFFITVYYLVNRFFEVEPYKSFLNKYDSFLLLLLIVISCLLNSFWDKCLCRLSHLDENEQSSIKILGMIYMMVIFAYIKYIYENDNYDMYITYFLGIMIGRFVYFDASFKDFAEKIGGAFRNIPVMLLGLFCTGVMAYFGFSSKILPSPYFIKHIGVVTNVCIAHIFLCIAIFIIFHLHPEKLIRPKDSGHRRLSAGERSRTGAPYTEGYAYDEDEDDAYGGAYDDERVAAYDDKRVAAYDDEFRNIYDN